MNDLNRFMYAVCATIFLTAAGVLLVVYGGPYAKVLSIAALVFAGGSQFVAQENTHRAQGAAWVLIIAAAMSFVSALAAFVVTSLGN